jgi:ABC-type amino acid transport substrate-binding protein
MKNKFKFFIILSLQLEKVVRNYSKLISYEEASMNLRKMKNVAIILFIATIAVPQLFSADLDEILKKGTVRIGMYNQDPGRMFIDPATNQLMGLEPDIAQAFAKKLGVKCEIVQAEWDALIPGLLADKWDIIIANMARLPSRAATVDFTLAFENYGAQTLAVRKDNTHIKGWNDLKKGVKVGTGRGNAAEAYVLANFPAVPIVPFASPQVAIQARVGGQDDVGTESYAAMISFEAANPRIKLIATNDLRAFITTGFAVKPGNFRLWLWANLFLIDFKNSGEYALLWKKWFPTIPVIENPFEVNANEVKLGQ